MMNIGDLVRSLHGSEEGFITKLIDEQTVEIEIEDGFTLPILIKDIVVVQKEESNFFEQKQETYASSPKRVANQGIFLSFIPASENFFDLHFINNTEYELHYTIHQLIKTEHKGISAGTITAKQGSFVNKWSVTEFDQWGELKISVLHYQQNNTQYEDPLHCSINFHAKSFFSNKKNTPILDKEGHVYQINQSSSKPQISTLKHEVDNITSENSLVRPEDIVDLHIEKLTDPKLPKNEVLPYQLRVFENTLASALATGMSEITFIHGHGSGVLKHEIHKTLSNHKNVAFFQDAQKNKFGYGATYVSLK